MEQIQFIVSVLADNYGFDETEALEYVITVKREKSPAYARAIKAIETSREKISELEQKIATNKVRKLDKAQEKLAKFREKLEEQESKLEEIGKPKPRKPRTPKPAPEPAPEPEKPAEKPKKGMKKEAAAKPAAKPEEKPKEEGKRISRMSPMLAKKLEDTFKEYNAEMNDKTKKAFVAYVNDLTPDDFDAKTLTEHMRDYVIHTVRPSEEKDVETLEHNELVKLKNLVDGYSAGVYWDPNGKRFVSGPDATDDDDVDEVEMDLIKYSVCEANGRVYEMTDDGDVFAGFKGVGKFKNM